MCSSDLCLFLISCRGKGDLKTLTHCEISTYFDPSSENFNSLIYLNELLIKLLEKEDPHPEIFDHYLKVCDFLKHLGKKDLGTHLRFFELNLLKEIGYGLDLKFEANSNNEIKEENRYAFNPIIGFQPLKDSNACSLTLVAGCLTPVTGDEDLGIGGVFAF